ncbi:hypothetical protein [Nocardia otitidiscaviarum]|uniref:hypothetical protein n=1 Tax=Nocardia otitidiscaviarum TaxID=1823 RepID=UPI0004A743F3|nr:hypothetical protein [Nocardia otitidiscaviarum]
MPDRDLIGVPTYDELMRERNELRENVTRLTSTLDHTEEQLADARTELANLRQTARDLNRLWAEDYGRLSDERDSASQARDDARARIAELEATVAAIRTALAAHPRCDVHPDGDPISCGWKRAVADLQHALDEAVTGGA